MLTGITTGREMGGPRPPYLAQEWAWQPGQGGTKGHMINGRGSTIPQWSSIPVDPRIVLGAWALGSAPSIAGESAALVPVRTDLVAATIIIPFTIIV